ncbi:MAG: hypothetical protein NZ523_11185 [Elioraea sp.]|nr:hypothetical protein [Elioraea sp.]MDW8443387.1 hypothetical protein [Acetobacteraceae bacterium]
MSASVLADLARPALASFAVSLIAAALLGRIAPRAAWLAVPAGLLVGLIDLVGVRLVTPRLLPERLPWLVAASAAVAPFLADRGHAGWVASGLAALVGAWWLVGAPRTAPDLERVAASAPAVALLILAALAPWSVRSSRRELSSLALAAVAAAALLALAGAAPLFSALALVAAGAAIGAVLAPGAPSPPAAAAVPLAAALAGTAAVAWLAEPSLAVSAAAALPVVLHGALGARR